MVGGADIRCAASARTSNSEHGVGKASWSSVTAPITSAAEVIALASRARGSLVVDCCDVFGFAEWVPLLVAMWP